MSIEDIFIKSTKLKKSIDIYFRRGVYESLDYYTQMKENDNENSNMYLMRYNNYNDNPIDIEFDKREFCSYVYEKIDKDDTLNAIDNINIEELFKVFLLKMVAKKILINKQKEC